MRTTASHLPDDREGAARRFNHYRCQRCGAITITRHDTPGTTPFMIRCLARPGCTGQATSGFYRGSQDPAQVPHVVWIRPEGPARHDYLGQYPRRQRPWVRDHLDAGGVVPQDPRAFQ